MLRTSSLFIALIAILLSPKLNAQEVESAEAAVEPKNLPDGMEIYADFLAATGGRDARANVTTQQMSGKLKMSMPGGGEIAAPIQVFQSKPGKFQLIVDFSEMGVGELNQGTNGDVAWTMGPQGKRLLEGVQKEKMMARADMESVLQPELRYKTITCVGEEQAAGKTLYRVEFVPKKEGAAEIRVFDAETKLLVQTITKQPTGLGPVDVETKLSDYRDVAGLKLAFRNEISVKLPIGEQKQVMEFENVVINGELPDEAFTVPEAIQKLIAEKESGDAS